MQSSTWVIFLVVFLLLILAARRAAQYNVLRKIKKKKGKRNKMPQELIKEFIGKRCTVSLLNESFGSAGVITAVEENWIRFEPETGKQGPMLFNGDMVVQIKLLPERKK